MTTFNHNGTQIVKIENPILDVMPMNEVIKLEDKYSDDFIFVSIGGKCAIERGLVPDFVGKFNPNAEWHHFFVKLEDGTFEAEKINFK